MVEAPDCTCDELRGCPACFREAEALVGRRIVDAAGHEWEVHEVGEKDGFPIVCGSTWWARLDDIRVMREVAPGQVAIGG